MKSSSLQDESTYDYFSLVDIQILEAASYAQQEIARLLQEKMDKFQPTAEVTS